MSHKLTIEEMQNISLERGGWCLSYEYIDAHTKLWWQCGEGHVWDAVPCAIKTGHWCPECKSIKIGNAKRDTIENMQQIALERNGWCLSTEYVNSQTKLWFQCGEGHVWDAIPGSIKNRKSWCVHCRKGKLGHNIRLTIEDLQKLALERGWQCLSTEYINSKTKYLWQCGKGHVFPMTVGAVKMGNGCAKCSGNIKPTIEEVKEKAEERGFKCLSTEYIDNKTELKFQCSNEHIFSMKWNSFQQGRGCYICSSGLSERICREYFKLIFGKEFPSSFQKWLVNERGNKMQLDGYCGELKLAFEYQGRQHYEVIKGRFKNIDLEQRKKDDKTKIELCKKHGITLIIVPHTVAFKDMQKYIVEECRKYNVEMPEKIDYVDFRKLDVYHPKKLEKLQAIAKEKGGKCLSTKYFGSKIPLEFRCKNNHTFWSIPNNVTLGRWCKRCAEQKKNEPRKLKAYNDFKKVVGEKKGKILSDYINALTRIHIDCGNGHDWWVKPNSVMQGSWCPDCYKINRRGVRKYDRNYKKFPHKHTFSVKQ